MLVGERHVQMQEMNESQMKRELPRVSRCKWPNLFVQKSDLQGKNLMVAVKRDEFGSKTLPLAKHLADGQ